MHFAVEADTLTAKARRQRQHERADAWGLTTDDSSPPYCTTSVIGVVCENDPELAVTFTV